MNDTKFNAIASQIIKDKFTTPETVENTLKTHELYPLFDKSLFFIYLCIYQLIGSNLHGKEGQEHLSKSLFFAFLLGVEYQKSTLQVKDLEELANRDSN